MTCIQPLIKTGLQLQQFYFADNINIWIEQNSANTCALRYTLRTFHVPNQLFMFYFASSAQTQVQPPCCYSKKKKNTPIYIVRYCGLQKCIRHAGTRLVANCSKLIPHGSDDELFLWLARFFAFKNESRGLRSSKMSQARGAGCCIAIWSHWNEWFAFGCFVYFRWPCAQ